MSTTRHLPVAYVADEEALPPASAGARLRVGRGVPPEARLLPPPPANDGAGQGERLLQVGDIAKASGKTVRAIHHYEDLGLLRPHARSKGRYRLYDQGSITRVRWIGKLHDLGLSLTQIQEIAQAWEQAPSAPEAMATIRSIYLRKLEETRAQIAHLASLERELVASVDYLDTCDTCDPAEFIEACTDCHVHDRGQEEPELVAGIHGGNGLSRGGAVR